MRKALVVGVDHYEKVMPLFGCVNDAHNVKSALERHSDGTLNFDSCRSGVSESASGSARMADLADGITILTA